MDYLTTVAIVEDAVGDKALVESKIKEANAMIITSYHISPAWGISNVCTDWLDVWRAYEQARKALKMGVEEGYKKIISYDEIIENERTYYYPLDFEKRLIGCCKRSDLESMEYLIQILYAENFEKRTLGIETIERLYDEIESTIIKLTQPQIDEAGLAALRKASESKESEGVQTYFSTLSQVYTNISDEVKLAKSHSQTQLVERIQSYIQKVYKDSNLGLGMIASQFNISEGYISSVFKEQTGINFTEYVESLRIDKACKLLKETNRNINDIGESVGYNSVQSFRRAFKRIHGISPSELRKNKS